MSNPANNSPDSNATNEPKGEPIQPRLATPMTASSSTSKTALTASTDDADPGAVEAATTKKTKKNSGKKKSRWWWRWTKRLAIAGLAARIALWLFLEQLANFGAGFAGLSVEWRSASLSISGLSLHIEDLVVRNVEDAGGSALLSAQEVVADLSMRQLLSGQISVVDAGIAGARVTVHRNPDGTLRLPKAWLEPAAVTLPPEEEAEVDDDQPLSFELPLWIASTRLHDLQFDFVDESVTPETRHTGKLDLDVSDVGFPDRNGSVMLRVHAPQLCDELFAHAQVQAATSKADVTFQAAVRGFRPQQFDLPQEFVDMIENAHVVDVRLGGDLHATILPSAPKHPALAGGISFGLALDGIERSTITSKFGPTEAIGAGTVDAGVKTPFSLTMHADGIVEMLRLQDGQLVLSGTRTGVNADLRGEGLTGVRIQPVLEAAGLELPESGLDLDASLNAEFGDSMSVDLSGVKIRSQQQQLLEIKRVAIRDVRTVDDTLAIGTVELIGPVLPIRKEADGSMLLAGLRITTPTTVAAETPQPAATVAVAEPVSLPKLRLGSLDWTGTKIVYTDATQTPETTLSLQDLHVHADAIAIGEVAPPGRLTVQFSVPDVLQRFTAELNVKSTENSLGMSLQSTTSGITLQGVRNWLEPLGIQSELQSGEFRFGVGAELTLRENGFAANAELANLRFSDGDQKLLSLRSVRGSGINESNLGTWAIQDPFVKVHRDAEQVLHAVGLRLGPSTTAATASTAAPASPDNQATTPKPRRRPNTLEPVFRHGELSLDRTTIAWTDARYPDRTFAIGLDAKIGANGGDGKLPVELTLRLDRAMQSCGIEAVVQLSPTSDTINGKLKALGIQGSELAMLLPEGMSCTLVDGELNASFDAGIHKVDSSAMHAKLLGLKLQDRTVELAAIDEVVFDVASASETEVHITDAHVRGIRATVTMTPEALHVPGFAFATATTQPAPPTAKDPAPEDPAPKNSKPDDSAPATTTPGALARKGDEPQPTEPKPTEPKLPAQPPVARSEPLTLPKLRIDALALELERFELRDRRGEEAEPLVLQTNLKLQEPWIGDPNADVPSPMLLKLTGGVQPLGAKFAADTKLSPFDLTPTLDIDFTLDSFDTTQLQRVMPSLANQLRGEATALTATAKVHGFLNMKRRNASKFDFSRALGAELTLENLELRDANTEQPYASIANIDAVVRAIHPASGSLLLRSLTIDDPQFRVEKDKHGTHIAGFLLPAPPTPTPSESPPVSPPTDQSPPDQSPPGQSPPGQSPPGQSPSQTSPSDPAPKATTPVPVAKPDKPAPSNPADGELAIDRFDLLGLKIDFKDATTDPPTHLLLADTDAELRRFSTRAFTEPRPMSFSVAVRGGPVKLERRVIKSSVLAGLLTAGAEALVGANQEHEYEQRAMLDELRANGQLQLFPTTIGRVNVSLTDLELAAFRGLAEQAGVNLTDGLYDARVNIEMKGYDGIDIRSNHVLTHLALDEPPDGPIYRYLRLPAPIQTVLFLLRNEDGQQRLPISLHVPADGVSKSTIIDLAVQNLVKLIGDAFGSAGARVLGGATGGLLGGSSDVPDLVIEIPFANGSPLPDATNLKPLTDAAIADETLSIVLTHEMGAGDQPRAHQLANPEAEVVQATIARLQRKRTELEAERTPLAADVVALYAAGKSQEALRTQQKLRAVDDHLGELYSALAEAITQIGNPSERSDLRRTRAAAMALGEARLDAVSQELANSCPQLIDSASEDAGPRIERRPGRGLPIAGLPDGGRVVAVLRRRAAQDLPSKQLKRKPGDRPTVRGSRFTGVPPVADPSNRAFNSR